MDSVVKTDCDVCFNSIYKEVGIVRKIENHEEENYINEANKVFFGDIQNGSKLLNLITKQKWRPDVKLLENDDLDILANDIRKYDQLKYDLGDRFMELKSEKLDQLSRRRKNYFWVMRSRTSWRILRWSGTLPHM